MTTATRVHRGAISLFEAGIWITISLIVLVIGISVGSGLFSRNDTNTEMGNISELMTNTRNMLKVGGSYQFASDREMTGALIRFGGAPGNMAIMGDKSSGQAILNNLWGKSVTLAPDSVSGQGSDSGFVLRYDGVPDEACTTLITKLGSTTFIDHIRVNGHDYTSSQGAAMAAADCQSAEGGKDNNRLEFYSAN
ncbi:MULTISPECIES: type 4 pilus major pilin [Tatumella]|uniref:Type 4 pilus major pilin n=1 Tax=Tatumella punctata TaxID=399969 RepID=A0ABW1VJI0_9GAMM|nr:MULTISPECIES: type 4 pilus major pilin [unclassified Tatumella]MBS0855540.1 prepilin [Tatumella sp. JGM16]MBS0877078.1 prepilin [Tatumella sp. JGM82]MBS0890654.1 prepilin [Tatumella sp. JGM94]MBS0893326.1 prepilin [Tatumella sp. JGM130]MBS0901381.1 prepilin [Tatumella sp. JGM100]